MSTPDLSTREGREQLRALADKATPGPWEAEFSGEQGNCVLPPDYRSTREAVAVTRLYYAQADAEFIAAARTAIPVLLDALDTAEARADRAEAALQRVREACDGLEHYGAMGERHTARAARLIRGALNDGDPSTPCGRGPCALGDGHTGNCRM